MTNTTNKKWSDEAVAKLLEIVGDASPVSVANVEAAAAALDVSTRSISSKLRNMDRAVESMAQEKPNAFTEQEGADLAIFVRNNAGNYTYKEISETFASGKFSAKQVQGKLLALELTGSVKAAPKTEAARSYTEAEESTFVAMANAGAFIEDIASALGKEIASVRGKALSLTRQGSISQIPGQKESHAKVEVDAIAALGDTIATMSVADIAKAADKTERGIKTILTRRGIKVADYDGASKKAKAEAKASA